MHHIKQCGTARQIGKFLCLPKLSCQQANTSTAVLGMTQETPNRSKTMPIIPKQMSNEEEDGLQIHYLSCTYNTNPALGCDVSGDYQLSEFFLKPQSKQKKLHEVGLEISI
jgi:hypothetical protein